jgi:uncharacterized protein YacL
MSLDFISRIVGMIIFALIGARVGIDIAPFIGYPQEGSATLFAMFGVLTGLILTPWLTVRPFRILRRTINEMPVETLLMALAGAIIGLLMTLLVAYPLSLLGAPLGNVLPLLVCALGAYLGATTFATRALELWDIVQNRGTRLRSPLFGSDSQRQLLLDTSVLIDGRIVEISRTGFLGGQLLIPRFVLAELHQVADSSDMLRRNRGRRGLVKLNELQRNEVALVRIIEDDIEDITEVDNKLVALAKQMDASIVTNDYNLNKVAHAQGVNVLNINLLANAVRTVYIPGETFPIHVIQEGRDVGQGVGYLEDGTMVVIENGKAYMDRHINVTVTRLINRETGRMIFAVPEGEKPRFQISAGDGSGEG